MTKFLIEKYEKYHTYPQWIQDITGRTSTNFYILWLDNPRKIKLGIVLGVCVLSLLYNLLTFLSIV